MIPKRTEAEPDLFSVSLTQVIHLDHPLVRLAKEFDWEQIRREIEPCFNESQGRPGAPVRLVIGLFYLKSAFNLSDEQVTDRWLENPYWQWFCGYETMQHQMPIDSTTLSRWRVRVGAERLEMLLKQTVEIAQRQRLLRPQELNRITVDTTVQPKAIAFPTDSRLYYKMIRNLVREAMKFGLLLRQTYSRVSKRLLVQQGRYARARQGKRARKCQKRLHTILGRLTRDIARKLEVHPSRQEAEKLQELLELSQRLQEQTRTSSNKIYSVHEPHVECIAKGKAHKKYEFGCKVSVAVTSNNWVVGVQAVHGNPFDGHTLNRQIDQVVHLTGVDPEHVLVDRGYRGHQYSRKGRVHIAGSILKSATRAFRKMLKRRSAIEPTIGHLKSDHRLERNFLQGRLGDKINALMSGAGYNFRKLLWALAWAHFYALLRLCYTILSRFGIDRIVHRLALPALVRRVAASGI